MENKGFVTKQGKDMPLGVSLQNNMFNFAVSMPGSSSCNLVLYKKGETDPAEKTEGYPAGIHIFCGAAAAEFSSAGVLRCAGDWYRCCGCDCDYGCDSDCS